MKSTNLNIANQKYFDTNAKVEKWTSRIFKFISNIFVPLMFSPLIGLYLHNYFTSNFLGNNIRLFFNVS